MANENMDEWGTNTTVYQETVRAVVEAYAAGLIALEPVAKKTKVSGLRSAPSFKTDDHRDAANI